MLEDFCTAAEAAAILKVSRQSAYNLARLFEWETLNVAGRVLYRRTDVQATPPTAHERRLFSQQIRRKREEAAAKKSRKKALTATK